MEPIQRNFLSNDLITITFLAGIVLVFLMKMYKPKYLLGYTLSFFTQGFIQKRAEENTSLFSLFYSFLFLFSVLTVSIILFTLLTPNLFEKKLSVLLSISLASFIYFALKYIISYGLMILFNLKKELKYFMYTKNGYLHTACLLIFPILIINQYFLNNNSVILFLISFLLIFRVFLILINNKKLIFNNMYYFILYLCALELAPLLILYRTIN